MASKPKKRGSSFLETAKSAFMPKNKDVMKEEAAAPNRAEIDRNNQLMQAPVDKPAAQKQPEAPPVLQNQIIRNQETGEITGVKKPDGTVIMAGNKREAKELIDTLSDTSPWPTPKGFVEAEDVQQQQQQFMQQQQAIQQLQQGVNGVAPTADLSEDPDAATAALNPLAIGAGIAGGASAGAAAGTFIGGPVGTVVGGVVGGIVGGISAYLGKLASDKRQSTKEAYKVFTLASGERSTQLLNLANSGTVPPADIVFAYEQNVANIRASRASLREKTRTLVGRQLSGAQDELIAVETWLANEQFYRAQLMQAISNPNPAKMYAPVPLTDYEND